MNRPLAFIAASISASLTVSSACLAQSSDLIRFTLQPDQSNASKIEGKFREGSTHHENVWSTGFSPSDLIGLEVSPFRAPGSRPLHFAIVRDAGRLDCAGHGGGNYASGNCSFSENPAFNEMLISRGIRRPTRDEAFTMTAVNVRRELVNAISAARYPTPAINDLVALAALKVDARYIGEMAQAGYHPQSLQRLIELKAVGVTPQWIGGFARIGYANLPGEGLVQLRALRITPQYIEGFQRIGYRTLPVETLVQLKALDITPQFVTSVAGTGREMPTVDQLVRMKMFGKTR